jgi:hypothetical protein
MSERHDPAEQAHDRRTSSSVFPSSDPVARFEAAAGGRRAEAVDQQELQGMIVPANRLTPGQAVDLLRAQACTAGRLLDDIADDIATGRLPVPVLHTDQ